MSYKKLLKKFINNSLKFDIESIKKRLTNYEYISFDIFDTLIKRDVVNIEDVFSIVEQKYNRLYKPDSITGFKQLRKESEKKARLNNQELDEVTLAQIYELMEDFGENKKEKLKQLECITELEVCTRHLSLYELFQWCLENGKKVIITSDMYLDRKTIETILNKNGYQNYYKLYLSSEIGYTKGSGKIFRYILQDLKINPSQLIHIGDNLKGDFLQPRFNKISSILLPIYINNKKFNLENELEDNEKECYKKIKVFINNRIDPSWDIYYSFGYEIFGQILLGFSYWLYNNLQKEGLNRVFFFSRDGYLMKRAFDLLFSSSQIQTRYLYVSRRSIRIPLISKNPSYENVVNLVIGKRYFDLKYFFKNIGLEIDHYSVYLEKLKINPDKIISKKDLLSIKKYKELFEIIQTDMVKNSNFESANLTGYLNQEEFNNKVAIVDIGWRGTMQSSLLEYNPALEIKGYYMGLSSKAYGKKDMYGFLFSPNSEDDVQCEKYLSFVGLFELLFLALEGSTKKYSFIENSYKPVLSEYEYEENSMEVQRLRNIQSGALKFIEDVIEANFDMELFTANVVYNDLRMFGRKPKNNHVNLFGDFEFEDSIKNYLAKPRNILKYMFNLKQLKKDFTESAWKIGFLKRLFKVSISYDKLYDFFKKSF